MEGLIPQKIGLVLVDEKKYQKIVFGHHKVKKRGQNGGTYISPNIEGAPSPNLRLQDSGSPCYGHGHAHVVPMGKWPWRCASTDQESSYELDLEWISPAVAELQHPQNLDQTNGRRDGRTNGRMETVASPFFLGWVDGFRNISVVRSTGAYERLSGHPTGLILGWVAPVEYPVPKHYTCQAVRPGFRESFSWLSIVLRMRRKIEFPPT